MLFNRNVQLFLPSSLRSAFIKKKTGPFSQKTFSIKPNSHRSRKAIRKRRMMIWTLTILWRSWRTSKSKLQGNAMMIWIRKKMIKVGTARYSWLRAAEIQKNRGRYNSLKIRLFAKSFRSPTIFRVETQGGKEGELRIMKTLTTSTPWRIQKRIWMFKRFWIPRTMETKSIPPKISKIDNNYILNSCIKI